MPETLFSRVLLNVRTIAKSSCAILVPANLPLKTLRLILSKEKVCSRENSALLVQVTSVTQRPEEKSCSMFSLEVIFVTCMLTHLCVSQVHIRVIRSTMNWNAMKSLLLIRHVSVGNTISGESAQILTVCVFKRKLSSIGSVKSSKERSSLYFTYTSRVCDYDNRLIDLSER